MKTHIVRLSIDGLDNASMNLHGAFGSCMTFMEQHATKIGLIQPDGGLFLAEHGVLLRLLANCPCYHAPIQIEVFSLLPQEAQLVPPSGTQSPVKPETYRIAKP